MAMTQACAVVPAAGRSERFGSQKLVADVGGEPLLNRTLRSLLEANLDPVILVVSPTASLDVVDLVRDPRVKTVVNPDPARGMFSSIQTGLAQTQAPIVAVLPADMPFVTSATIRTVVAYCERTGQPVVPLFHGQHGHPLALPGRVSRELVALDARQSLKEALAHLGLERDEIAIDDPGIVRDIDTRADLGVQGS